ncbi:MAG: hypothetical protein V3W31_09015 [Thermodesulfobacteriota bacterium]
MEYGNDAIEEHGSEEGGEGAEGAELKPHERPTSVTVIAWIFIVVSVLAIIFGGLGLLLFALVGQMGVEGGQAATAAGEHVSVHVLGPFKDLTPIFRTLAVIQIVQIGVGLFVMLSAVYLLKLKAWARTVLEVVSWLGLLKVGLSAAILYQLRDALPELKVEGLPIDVVSISLVGNFTIMLIMAASLVVIIALLRGKKVREAVV